jgi:hypothetical protein
MSARTAGSRTQEHTVRVVTVTRGLSTLVDRISPRWPHARHRRPGRLRVVADGKVERTVDGLPASTREGRAPDGCRAPSGLRAQRLDLFHSTRRRTKRANGTELARARLAGGPGNYRLTDRAGLFGCSRSPMAGCTSGRASCSIARVSVLDAGRTRNDAACTGPRRPRRQDPASHG